MQKRTLQLVAILASLSWGVVNGQTLELNGHPLSVHVDERGTMGVLYSGRGSRTEEYYSTYAKGSALFLNGTNNATRFGSGTSTFALWDHAGIDQFSPVSHTVVGSNMIVTVLAAGQSGAHVTQTVTVQTGLPFYTIQWAVANAGQVPYVDVRFIHGGDVSPGGKDFTTGGWNVTSNMVFVLSSNVPPDFMGLLGGPDSLADAYHEGHFELVKNASKSGQLPSTVETNLHDAAYALQWNREVLGPGETWEISAIEVWLPATGEVEEAGSLLVTIEPAGARDAGAQWRALAGPDTSWHSGGTTVPNLPTGEYAVVFSDIAGWLSPTQQTFAVLNGRVTQGTGAYIQALGDVTVTIEPPFAILDGAEWRLTSGPKTNWQASGTVVGPLPTGNYSVVYQNVEGWHTPGIQGVTVTVGATTSTTGVYAQMVGNLLVAVEPQGARDAGAMWRATTGLDTNWHVSGFSITNLIIGECGIAFLPVEGWLVPSQQVVVVTDGRTAAATGTYVEVTGQEQDVTAMLDAPLMLDWQLSRQTGTYFGSLHLKTFGQISIVGPIFIVMDSNTARRFMTPAGTYPDGRQYIDVTSQFNAAQPDGRLDPGDEVIVPGIEVYIRDRTVPPDSAFSVNATVAP